MIINVGQRTDIPAFFSKWFLERLDAGFVMARSPYARDTVYRYSLLPEDVDLFVFCTKDPRPMLPHMHRLREYKQYWFVTMTAYGREIEPNVPDKRLISESIKELSRSVGSDRVAWRYDPIFIDPSYTVESHIEIFRRMAEDLRGYTDTCIFSFVDLYEKTKKNFPGVREVTSEEKRILSTELRRIAEENGMVLKACCEPDTAVYGIDCSGCMSAEVISKAAGKNLRFRESAMQSRKGCRCILSNDIGVYNTCSHGCVYCYANYSAEKVAENLRRHDPHSPLLIGNIRPGDRIIDVRDEEEMQTDLFDLMI